jgi:hypothetical protein
VPAGLDDDLEIVLTREGDRSSDLLGAARPGDDRRPPVMDCVPETARIVVRRVARRDDVSAGAPELIDVVGGEGRRGLDDLSSLERRKDGLRPVGLSVAIFGGGDVRLVAG